MRFYTLLSALLFTCLSISIYGQNIHNSGSLNEINKNSRTDQPSVDIHDTTASPGDLLLQVDAFDFTGDNGQVAAITLCIDIDTNLLTFKGIKNTTLNGSWFANYNTYKDYLIITYNAPQDTGYDIDGKLLDIKFFYHGGFTADLTFIESECEITDKNLQTIDSVEYKDGSITQTTAVGQVYMDTIRTHEDAEFDMPLEIGGQGYDSVSTIKLRIYYDTSLLTYEGFTEYTLTGINVDDTLSILNVYWSDITNPVDFTTSDTILMFHFTNNDTSNTVLEFKPGSKVYNNDIVVASEFINGLVQITFYLELEADPAEGGSTSGSGYYLPDEEVNVSATSEPGYSFDNWTMGDSIVSYDSSFIFTMPDSNVTLTANFSAIDYTVTLYVDPYNSGYVSGDGTYNVDDSVTVTATPAVGYEFEYWTEGDSIVSYDSVYEFIMPPRDIELTANFALLVYTINAEPNNPDYGTVTGAGEYEHGDTVTLTAIPNEGYQFVVWTEDGSEVHYEEEYVFVAVSDRELIAHFQVITECPKPVALSVDDITLHSATLHWVPSGEEQEWDIIWGYTGFDTTDQGNLISGLTETEYLLDSLESGTLYDFYVRAICSDTTNSGWAGPETFSTLYVGQEHLKKETSFVIYPNPAKNELNIRYKQNTSLKAQKLQIINSLGIVVIEYKNTINDNFSVNLTGLKPGTYIIRLQFDNIIKNGVFIHY